MPTISDQDPQAALSLPNFFSNLDELDEWSSKPRSQTRLDGLLEYSPRSKTAGSAHEARGGLLVCHDYKGGYTESPSALGYTFNFWQLCDTFIYFSHQRVAIPPPGWVNAAHKQGVKMLGVLIFEHGQSVEDTLRLLLGKLPKSSTGPPATLLSSGFPISRYYARLLADLAYDRGFDGYLLNFEYPFPGQSDQARAIEAWVNLLNEELKRRIGDYAETVWYDSIITTGALAWQDRLNSRNLSFFLASDTFFSNYTWPTTFPSFSAQYFLSLAPKLLQGDKKTLQDIYIGIDVWGRGSYGGGGLGVFRAAEIIDPAGLGLSIALFAPGWTWESDEGAEGRTWEVWWDRERTFWVGPAIEGTHVEVPPWGGEVDPNEVFKPISDFFLAKPAPKPDTSPFCATFCPGVGRAWFVKGKKVLPKEQGWTDVDKQTSLGNLLWPRPQLEWWGSETSEELPKASTDLTFEDAFNSGSSVIVRLNGEGSSQEGSAFRGLRIPIQSITLALGGSYEVELVYKVSSGIHDFDLALSVTSGGDTEVQVENVPTEGFDSGWSRVFVTCKPVIRSNINDSNISLDVLANIGIVFATTSEDASVPYTIDIHLGQLSVSSKSPIPDVSPYLLRLLWADVAPDSIAPETLVITWDSCISYTEPAIVTDKDLVPEVPRPPWILDRSRSWFPRLQYSNVYAEKRISDSGEPTAGSVPSEKAVFLGTGGWGSGPLTAGGPNIFLIEKSVLPEDLRVGGVRFYVQGVTDRGEVLPWERCAFVDFNWIQEPVEAKPTQPEAETKPARASRWRMKSITGKIKDVSVIRRLGKGGRRTAT